MVETIIFVVFGVIFGIMFFAWIFCFCHILSSSMQGISQSNTGHGNKFIGVKDPNSSHWHNSHFRNDGMSTAIGAVSIDMNHGGMQGYDGACTGGDDNGGGHDSGSGCTTGGGGDSGGCCSSGGGGESGGGCSSSDGGGGGGSTD